MRSTSRISAAARAWIALGELRRQLGLEHDDRQRVAEQIVHVARDPLALGDLGELFRLVVRFDQRPILAAHFTKMDVGAADEQGDDRLPEPRMSAAD